MTTPTTPDWMKEISEACEKATKGPWLPSFWIGPIEWPEGLKATIMGHGPRHEFTANNAAALRDSEFIALSRTAVPRLLAAIKIQQEALLRIGCSHIMPCDCIEDAEQIRNEALAKVDALGKEGERTC